MIEKKQNFDMNKPTFAKRNFCFDGIQFKVDELFDWQKLGVTLQKVEKFFRAGYVIHKSGFPQKPLKEKKEKTPKKDLGKPLSEYTEKEIAKMPYPKLKQLCSQNDIKAVGKANELRKSLLKVINKKRK